MGDSPDNQGEWRQDPSAEPPADLLRRALSHVEDLLGRLEYPAVSQGEIGALPDDGGLIGLGLADPDADGSEPAGTPPVPDGAGWAPNAGASSPRTPAAPRPADAPHPVARDESDGLGRDVDGDAILARARRSADATVAAARVEAERLLVAARAEAAELREQGRVEGADLTQQAAFEAEQTLADAHAAAGALLSSARAEADRVVRAAHERTSPGAGPGNPELDTHVAAAVASAVAAAGDAATTHAGDGSALIGAAQRLVERLRDELQAVLGPTAGSVTSLGSSVRALDELAGPPSDPSATEGGSPASADVPRRIPAHPATHPASAEVTAGQGTDAADDADGRQEHRGPLGQLFGAARR